MLLLYRFYLFVQIFLISWQDPKTKLALAIYGFWSGVVLYTHPFQDLQVSNKQTYKLGLGQKILYIFENILLYGFFNFFFRENYFEPKVAYTFLL